MNSTNNSNGSKHRFTHSSNENKLGTKACQHQMITTKQHQKQYEDIKSKEIIKVTPPTMKLKEPSQWIKPNLRKTQSEIFNKIQV